MIASNLCFLGYQHPELGKLTLHFQVVEGDLKLNSVSMHHVLLEVGCVRAHLAGKITVLCNSTTKQLATLIAWLDSNDYQTLMDRELSRLSVAFEQARSTNGKGVGK